VSALAQSRSRGIGIPLWMGIVNLTPDSFSDGGAMHSWDRIESRIDSMIASGAHILDFGAESTRPGARQLTADEEWARLEPVLERVVGKLAGDPLRPRLSVDTYHADVARRALDCGIDIVNDVGGLGTPEMLELAASTSAEFVAMHNLGLPANPGRILSTTSSAADQVEAWLDGRLESWRSAGIDSSRIVFDPGIGFGKNPLQSLELLREIERFRNKGLRLLVGHSRKSFMTAFASPDLAERDLVTTGASLALVARGVDILRVHNVEQHTVAWRGWMHLQSPD
jgi:dihydropteroate synthase